MSSKSILRYAKSVALFQHYLQKKNHDISPSCEEEGLDWVVGGYSFVSELKSPVRIKIQEFPFPFHKDETLETNISWQINQEP